MSPAHLPPRVVRSANNLPTASTGTMGERWRICLVLVSASCWLCGCANLSVAPRPAHSRFLLLPFPAPYAGATRCCTVPLCYAGCVPMSWSAHSHRRRTVTVQLCFLLSTLLLDMTYDAVYRFMRDSVGGCYSAERFFLLHHTLYKCRPRVQQEYHSSAVSALVVGA
jgi:hypothetical protein